MNPGVAGACEIHMAAFGEIDLKLGGDDLDLRIDLFKFCQPSIPALVEIPGFGVDALVCLQLVEGHVEKRHKGLPFFAMIQVHALADHSERRNYSCYRARYNSLFVSINFFRSEMRNRSERCRNGA